MNISYNWLQDYLQFDLTPEQTAAALTSIGLETGGIEEVQTIRGGLEGLVIGKVLTCKSHPNSDHLHVTTVDLGDGNPQQIVCGAANVATGQKVVVATLGTKLYSGEESFTIKRSKIRGEESFGMICAEDEIGIGTGHDGIIVLPEEAPVGMPAKEYFNVKSDYVLEVDITPNRVDAASHYGVARDLAACLIQRGERVKLTKPLVDGFKTIPSDDYVRVTVENSDACPRYSGVTLRGVNVTDSPDWLKNRLTAIGLRPINNVVDITNYLLHETGHPLHAFDKAQINGNHIYIRTRPEGEKFTTLDEVERTLSANDLMICNEKEGMCIAGVFGGLKSGVTNSTTDIFIESAYFDPTWVRKTARRHGLNTDSSFRFERGADPNNTLYVLKRAALMITELAGGEIVGEIQDLYPTPIGKFPVEINFEKINSLIGKEIPCETVCSILSSLEIEIVNQSLNGLSLLIPTYRVDVRRDVDVIEDILRIYGYNNIDFSSQVKSNLSYKTVTDQSHKLQNLVSEQLVGGGFNEILNNSLTKSFYYDELTAYPAGQCVPLMNPLSADLSVMRQTLLFGGLESISRNRNRKNADIRFFEFGNCYYYHPERVAEADAPLKAYSEEYHLGLWMSGNRVTDSWAHANEKTSIFELKAYIENILTRMGIDLSNVVNGPLSNDLFSSGLIYMTKGGKRLAELGIVQKRLLKRSDIDVEVYFAEINWTVMMKESQKNKVTYSELSKYPSVKRDLALLLDKKVTFEEIEKVVAATEKKLLKKVSLFDVYEGKNLPANKKSYAISVTLQDEEKTLTDKQIDNIMQRIQQQLEQQLEAKLR